MSRIFREICCGHFPWKLKDENLRKISPKFCRIFHRSLAKTSQELRSGGLRAQGRSPGHTPETLSEWILEFLTSVWLPKVPKSWQVKRFDVQRISRTAPPSWTFFFSELTSLEDPNLLKLRSLDSSWPFFLSDNSIWGQWTQMPQMLGSQG